MNSNPPIDSNFGHALSVEILGSEQIRVTVVAATLIVILVADQLLFLFALDGLQAYFKAPLPWWLPLRVIGPFVVYEVIVLQAIRTRAERSAATGAAR